jgi:hypothetical protein
MILVFFQNLVIFYFIRPIGGDTTKGAKIGVAVRGTGGAMKGFAGRLPN